jgi:hypothetical protein
VSGGVVSTREVQPGDGNVLTREVQCVWRLARSCIAACVSMGSVVCVCKLCETLCEDTGMVCVDTGVCGWGVLPQNCVLKMTILVCVLAAEVWHPNCIQRCLVTACVASEPLHPSRQHRST